MAKAGWDWGLFRLTVIEAAIRGKLTADWRASNPNIEPAHKLLERIDEEKAELIRTKQIRKEKPLPPIHPDDVPFDIPKDWIWVKMNDVASYIQRGKSPKYVESSSVPVISQKCVRWEGLDMKPCRFIDESTLPKYQQVRFLKNEDVLWNSTGDGTVGRACLYKSSQDQKVVADSHVTVIRSIEAGPFLNYLIASRFVQDNLLVQGSTKQTELNL